MYAVVAAAVAVWAGMPAVFLSFLACPLMMFFMMKGRKGTQGNETGSKPDSSQSRPATPPLEDVKCL